MTAPRDGSLTAMDWTEFTRLVDAGRWPRGVAPERLAALRAEIEKRLPADDDGRLVLTEIASQADREWGRDDVEPQVQIWPKLSNEKAAKGNPGGFFCFRAPDQAAAGLPVIAIEPLMPWNEIMANAAPSSHVQAIGRVQRPDDGAAPVACVVGCLAIGLAALRAAVAERVNGGCWAPVCSCTGGATRAVVAAASWALVRRLRLLFPAGGGRWALGLSPPTCSDIVCLSCLLRADYGNGIPHRGQRRAVRVHPNNRALRQMPLSG
jgi:hypothetical protein